MVYGKDIFYFQGKDNIGPCLYYTIRGGDTLHNAVQNKVDNIIEESLLHDCTRYIQKWK